MFNARRSALYLAIIGLGFAAGDANAACAAGYRAVSTYTAGYKTTVCVKSGSEVVEVQVEPTIDGGEGPLSDAIVNVSLTGSSPDGDPPAPIITLLQVLSPTTTGPKPPKPPKTKQCTVSVPNDDGDDDGEFDKRGVQCQNVGDPSVPPNLVEFVDPNYNPVDTLVSPDKAMKCNIKKGECHTTVEILPTGLFCADTIPPNKPAIDFTAKPDADNSFILTVDVNGTDSVFNVAQTIEEFFGCYALAGKNYSCESFTTGSAIGSLCGDGVDGFIGATSSLNYCFTGSLPAGDLFCAL